MTQTDLTPQTAKRAADPVVDALQARIASGRLSAGDSLPSERALMAEFGVSRTVVREAVRQLGARGMIDARPRHRPIVRSAGFDTALDAMGAIVGTLLAAPDGVRNLFETRILVEVALTRAAATNAQKDDIATLKMRLDANKSAIEDNTLFFASDRAFHAVLYDISGNPALPALHNAYSQWLAPQWGQMPRDANRNLINYTSHKAIFDAILMRDADAAEAAMRAHMADAWTQIETTFGDMP